MTGNSKFVQNASDNETVNQVQGEHVDLTIDQRKLKVDVDLGPLLALLSEIKGQVRQAEITPEMQELIDQKISSAEKQASQPTAKNTILEVLKDVTTIAGSITALSKVVPLVEQAADMARKLFAK